MRRPRNHDATIVPSSARDSGQSRAVRRVKPPDRNRRVMEASGAPSDEFSVVRRFRAPEARFDRQTDETRDPRPLRLALDDPRATDPALAGVKAARLAEAGLAGLPIVAGEVITTATTTLRANPDGYGEPSDPLPEVVEQVWAAVSRSGSLTIVVRSSSPSEDGERRSMAGQFVSVTDVSDHTRFISAVDEVIGSGRIAGSDVAMAILVQEQLEPIVSGVLFTVDPVHPATKGYSVAYIEGSPKGLVGGMRNGRSATLSRRGRRIDGMAFDTALTKERSRQLAALARRAEALFGSPQDIEWAFDEDDRLWLLQSRPITTLPSQAIAEGPVFGAGPVAETFPERLSPLEADMWVTAMAEGLRATMGMLRVAPQAQLDASPIVTDHDGWVVCDLDLLEPRPAGPVRRFLDPRPTVRRLRVAWRMGRLRAALPILTRNTISRADAALAAVGHPSTLSDAELAAVVSNGRRSLVALHAQEAAAGVFIDDDAGCATSAQSAALRVVTHCRERGLSDDDILQTEPATLAFYAPAVFPAERCLPDRISILPAPADNPDAELAILREALKLRIRWTQEVMAVCARNLALRLADAHRIPDPSHAVNLTLDQLVGAALTNHGSVESTIDRGSDTPGPPTRFRYSRSGDVVAQPITTDGDSIGVSGGRVSGLTWNLDDGPPPPGRILISAHMDPRIARDLALARGLVAESGNSLSHLAILARELSVPAIARVAGARDRFPSGSAVTIDGWDGSVTPLAEGVPCG